MNRKLKLIEFIIFFCIFIVLLFQNFLEQYISVVKSLDEVIPWMLLILFLVKVMVNKFTIKINGKILKNNLKILIYILFIALIGIIGNGVYRYQNSSAVLNDLLIVFKGFLTYVFASLLFQYRYFEDYYKVINNIMKFITLTIFILVISNYILKVFPSMDIRNGIPSQQLFFTHPTYLASFSVAIISILTLLQDKYKHNIYYIYLMTIVICSTLRSKAIMFIGIYYLVYYLVIKKEKRIKIGLSTLIVVLGVILGADQIIKYLSNSDWARSALMIKSFQVAKDHFPLGSGFATFGTWNSGVSYSQLYYDYHLSHIYGLTPVYYMYVADTYWPAIIAQFGVFGFILTIYILFNIFKNISVCKNKYKYLGKLSILMYLLILSTAESAFMSPIAPLLCLIMAL